MTTRNTTRNTTPGLVLVEVMPEHLRASHEAAGYGDVASAGRYPYNGAVQIEVSEEEAREVLDEHGRWARIVPYPDEPTWPAPAEASLREDFPF